MIHVDAPGAHTGKLLICFVFAAGLGGFELWRGLGAGRMKTIDAAALEAGRPPPGVWVRVDGVALWDKAAVLERSHNKVIYIVPVVSRDWQPSQAVAAFMELRRDSLSPAPTGPKGADGYDGTVVRWRGLGSSAKSQFRSHGLRPADDYVMLHAGGSPESIVNRGLVGVGLAVASLVAIGVIRWLDRFRGAGADDLAKGE